MKLTRQFDQMDCGPSCIRMVADHYGKEYPLSYLRSRSCLNREGVSVAGIRTALTDIGMKSASYELTPTQLREKCPLPAILHWDQNHFVVLYKVAQKRWGKGWLYHIANPAYGMHAFDEDAFCKSWLAGEKGVAIAIEPTDDFYARKPVKERHSLLRFGQKYVLPFKKEMLQLSFGLLAGILLSLLTPFLTQALVDDGIGMRDFGIIRNLLIAQLCLFVGSFVMGLISSWVTLYMGTRISIHILHDYLAKLLRLPMTFFETKSVGDYQQRISDHYRLQGFTTQSTIQTAFSLLSCAVLFVIIGYYSMVILGAYLLMTVMSTAWMTYFFRKRKALDYEQFKINSENQNKLFELMNGITDIKLNAYEKYKLDEWQEMQERLYTTSQRVLRLNQIQDTGYTVIGQTRNILITFWIAAAVVSGDLTLGMMMSISSIIGQVNGPLSQLIGFLRQFQDAKISLERSEEVHLCHDEDTQEQETSLPLQPKDIVLTNVTFRYTGSLGAPALDNVSLRIPAGKITAIVGESGSGKTTLMKLLLKFYAPSSGDIKLHEK
ncbi:MAG: cysteine peptidase family C39 domain-containing protein, partial [Bacteroidaceae bacterium]